ncbi:hypothetical protein [Neorhodopirellula lusitana]|uniref:hypothetical protein n=1 Tax=Neorhodopirellula lusitana TaxID=445327 RepID=UPI00384E2BFF
MQLSYYEHLWKERKIKSVGNLTQTDIEECIPIAAEIPLRPEVTMYWLEQANEALRELRRGQIKGAKVLIIGHTDSARSHHQSMVVYYGS